MTMFLPTPSRSLLFPLTLGFLLGFLLGACVDGGKDTASSGTGVDPGCLSADDPSVTLHFEPDTCAVVDYSCAASEESFHDTCGCGCRQRD